MSKVSRKTTSVHIDRRILAAAAELADQERRSRNQTLELLLADALKARGVNLDAA